MKQTLTPLQQHVATQYGGGEFAFVTSMAQAKTVGDCLFVFALAEAGDAADVGEFTSMLERAIDQLRSLRGEFE